jgi:hypothetical protein
MATLAYSLMKWIQANKDTLPAFGTSFPDLNDAVEQLLDIQRNSGHDIERLNHPELGINSQFLDRLCLRVSIFLERVHNTKTQIVSTDGGALLDGPGLGLEGLTVVRNNILGNSVDAFETENVTKHFDRYSMQWKVRLDAGTASRIFRVPCMPIPVALAEASLREQLDWIKEDQDASLAKLDAIVNDPESWPTSEQRRQADQDRLKELAQKFVQSMSLQDRQLVGRNRKAFGEELAAMIPAAS